MRPHHRMAVCLVVLLTIVGLAVLAAHASGLTPQIPAQSPHSGPRSDSGSLVVPDTTQPGSEASVPPDEWPELAAQQEADRQNAIAALSAAQAQALADQLQAAINRSLAAVPATQPASAPVANQSQACADLYPIVLQVFGADLVDHAMNVARKESGCTDVAYNPSGASGIFQIMMPMHAQLVSDVCGGGSVFDPYCNTLVAKTMYDGSGWGPWAASGG